MFHIGSFSSQLLTCNFLLFCLLDKIYHRNNYRTFDCDFTWLGYHTICSGQIFSRHFALNYNPGRR